MVHMIASINANVSVGGVKEDHKRKVYCYEMQKKKGDVKRGDIKSSV